LIAVPAAGFDRARPSTLLTSSAGILRSALKLRRTFAHARPDAVVGFGGYVAIPVGLAARWLHIPVIIHEQNSVPGMTNRFLAKRARAVAVTYPQTVALFRELVRPGTTVTLTGNPVRPEVLAADGGAGRARLGIPADALVLLVFGGSRGARHINEALCAAAPELLEKFPRLHIIHAAGTDDYERTRAVIEERLRAAQGGQDLLARYHLFAYLDAIADSLAAADLALTRAGATSIAELTALGKPAILVPYPHATDDHQTKNARDLAREGGAALMEDSALTSADFMPAASALLSDAQRRDTMAKAARSFGRPDAAARLADCVEAAVPAP